MEQLGIQPLQLLMQAINFVILLIVLNKFLYKPILEHIEKRKTKIKEGLALREEMQKEMIKLDELKNAKVEEGRKEARKIIKDARQTATKQADEIIAMAKKKTLEEQKKAARELKRREQQLRIKLKKEAVKLAADMAEKVIADLLKDEEKQQQLIRKRIKALEQIEKG